MVVGGVLILALSSMTSDKRYASVAWYALCLLPLIAQQIIRENLVASSARVKFFTDRCRKLGKFQGSHIITHNEIIREIFVRSGYVAPDNITSLGCLRMD